VEKAGKGRKEVVVTREYMINLHKRLHGCNLTLFFSVASPCVCYSGRMIELSEVGEPSSSTTLQPESVQVPNTQVSTLRRSDRNCHLMLDPISTSTYGVGGSVACHGESE
ncbi:unnamed protein product, partial [Musa acuminata var. zebrina]